MNHSYFECGPWYNVNLLGKNMRLSIFSLLMVFLTQTLSAQTITCLDREIGMILNNFSSRSVAESWFPKTVRITDDYVQFGVGDDRWYPRTPNRGESHLQAEIADPDVYKFRYNKNLKRLSVNLVADAGYRTSMIFYKQCSYFEGTSGRASNATTTNATEVYFKRMSLCDRKYVQQFLKGQNSYNGAIDGLWGRGTAGGLRSFKKTGNLRGLSDLQVLKRLEDNPVCD